MDDSEAELPRIWFGRGSESSHELGRSAQQKIYHTVGGAYAGNFFVGIDAFCEREKVRGDVRDECEILRVQMITGIVGGALRLLCDVERTEEHRTEQEIPPLRSE